MPKDSIYSPQFVSELFDSMSSTYGLTNYISSFGFTDRWRKQCVQKIELNSGSGVIFDLMSGMGELWSSINKSSIDFIEINAVDISPKMTSIAKGNLSRTNGKINLLQQDVLNNSISSNTADIVVSSFGLKTFNLEQLTKLAKEISRILKPGASFSFVEISVPPNPFLRLFYMFYLKVIIPIIGFLFQGNSGDYRMLGIYTSKFNNCKNFQRELTQAGLEANYQALFFGCATVTWGKKSGKVTEPISS